MNTLPEKQPSALYLLFFVQMWECFSYYGMRILLVLYMTQVMGFSDTQAFGVFAIYCALVEFGGIFGGRLADCILGQRPAIFLGGWLIALGHICMALGEGETFLYASLALIATGTGLFSCNVSSLLGMFYEVDDHRREEGFTLFYIGINVGAILATLLCGVIASLYGWHAGFGLAALGMILGNLALAFFSGCLKGEGRAPEGIKTRTIALCLLGVIASVGLCIELIRYQTYMMGLIPLICFASLAYAAVVISRNGSVSRETIASLGAYLIILTVFFAAEEQIGGSLLLFCERFGTGKLCGIPIPSSLIMGINPVIFICFGMVVSCLANRVKMSGTTRLMTGCLIAGTAFGLLSLSSLLPEVSLASIITGVALLSVGELLVGPTVYAFFSEAAPKKLQGVTMGLIPIGFSLASILSGWLNQSMALDSPDVGVELYTLGYARIAVLLLAAGLSIAIVNYKKEVIYGICRISQ